MEIAKWNAAKLYQVVSGRVSGRRSGSQQKEQVEMRKKLCFLECDDVSLLADYTVSHLSRLCEKSRSQDGVEFTNRCPLFTWGVAGFFVSVMMYSCQNQKNCSQSKILNI